MKKTILMSIVALAVSVAFVSGVMAESKPAPQETTAQEAKLEKFSGVVEKVDEATKERPRGIPQREDDLFFG